MNINFSLTPFRRVISLLIVSLLTLLALATVNAQEKDNSGTNPVNFTYDFRMWMEFDVLQGDNSIIKQAFEYRAPVSKKVAARFRGYRIDISLGSGATTTGFGDMDARLIWVPKVSYGFRSKNDVSQNFFHINNSVCGRFAECGVFAQEDQGWPHSSLNYRPPAPEAIQPTNDLTRIAIGLTQKKWYNNRGQVTLEARL